MPNLQLFIIIFIITLLVVNIKAKYVILIVTILLIAYFGYNMGYRLNLTKINENENTIDTTNNINTVDDVQLDGKTNALYAQYKALDSEKLSDKLNCNVTLTPEQKHEAFIKTQFSGKAPEQSYDQGDFDFRATAPRAKDRKTKFDSKKHANLLSYLKDHSPGQPKTYNWVEEYQEKQLEKITDDYFNIS